MILCVTFCHSNIHTPQTLQFLSHPLSHSDRLQPFSLPQVSNKIYNYLICLLSILLPLCRYPSVKSFDIPYIFAHTVPEFGFVIGTKYMLENLRILTSSFKVAASLI